MMIVEASAASSYNSLSNLDFTLYEHGGLGSTECLPVDAGDEYFNICLDNVW